MPKRSRAGSRVATSAALSTVLFLLAAFPAAAESVPVRTGQHPDRGRVVFDWSAHTGYRVEEGEGRVVLRFERPADFKLPTRLPRNVLDISAGEDGSPCSSAQVPGRGSSA